MMDGKRSYLVITFETTVRTILRKDEEIKVGRLRRVAVQWGRTDPFLARRLNSTRYFSSRNLGGPFLVLSSDTRAMSRFSDVVWYDLSGTPSGVGHTYYSGGVDLHSMFILRSPEACAISPVPFF